MRKLIIIMLMLFCSACATTQQTGKSGWDKCERNTKLAGMTSGLGAIINLFCAGAASIDRAVENEPKNEGQEEKQDKEKEEVLINERPQGL